MTSDKQLNPEETRQTLETDLKNEIRQHQNQAMLKSSTAQILFWIAIAASAFGTVNPTTQWFPSEAGTSILAAIPGVVLLIMNTFKYDARAKWHKLKQRKLEGLHRGLTFEGKDTKEISAALTATLEELEKLKVDLDAPSVK